MLMSSISDQKRLARGEHWKRAQYWLRARDGAHNKAWKVLIVAGPSPAEEINCVRELMPNAHITAVDIERERAEAALDAGADEAMVGDLAELEQQPVGSYGAFKYIPPLPLRERKFDAVCLDLSGPANDQLKRVVQAYFTESVVAQGVLILTMSYGRDVMERIDAEFSKEKVRDRKGMLHDPLLQLDSMPEHIASRLWFVLRSHAAKLDSCIAYKGAQMPMISALLVKKSSRLPAASFLALQVGDFELAVTTENLSKVYACPAERIAEIRRKAAAAKAVHTRKIRNHEGTGEENGTANEAE